MLSGIKNDKSNEIIELLPMLQQCGVHGHLEKNT
jgi:hypothetical protein